MRIEADNFFITAAKLEAGIKVNADVPWNAACTAGNMVYVTGFGEWHFRLPGSHLQDYLESLSQTAALPETDTSTCIDSSGNVLKARQVAREILETLELM